jgi:hypothetical protein
MRAASVVTIRASLASAAAVVALLLAPSLAQAQTGDPITALAWLSGCWARSNGPRLVEESWQLPRAGMMLGVGRTVNGNTLVEYEQTRIYQKGDTLVYAASPSGQTPTEFRARPPYTNEVIFENLAHDFPQRVRYKRIGKDSLHARVEGKRNGVERGVDFMYARVPCPNGSAN